MIIMLLRSSSTWEEMAFASRHSQLICWLCNMGTPSELFLIHITPF